MFYYERRYTFIRYCYLYADIAINTLRCHAFITAILRHLYTSSALFLSRQASIRHWYWSRWYYVDSAGSPFFLSTLLSPWCDGSFFIITIIYYHGCYQSHWPLHRHATFISIIVIGFTYVIAFLSPLLPVFSPYRLHHGLHYRFNSGNSLPPLAIADSSRLITSHRIAHRHHDNISHRAIIATGIMYWRQSISSLFSTIPLAEFRSPPSEYW